MRRAQSEAPYRSLNRMGMFRALPRAHLRPQSAREINISEKLERMLRTVMMNQIEIMTALEDLLGNDPISQEDFDCGCGPSILSRSSVRPCSPSGKPTTPPGSSNGTGSRPPQRSGRTSFHPRPEPRRIKPGVSQTGRGTQCHS